MEVIIPPAIHRVVLGQRFEVLRELGRGGMGVVFEVLDLETKERVALKTLKSMNADALLRFKNEFREFQDLHHPNIINLGELFCEHNEWFFTMELVRGVNVLAYVRSRAETPTIGPADETMVKSANADTLISTSPGGSAMAPVMPSVAQEPIDETKLRTSMRQLAQGLHALHVAGKVHRDVKPGNVLVTPEGRAVLLDFGLAVDLARRELQPEDHVIVGTVAYMAPEQAAAHPVTPAADWHAFGVVLYEALTGRLPFTGSSIEILGAKQTKEAVPPRDLVPETPADLSELCVELLRFNPAQRPSGLQVIERLGGMRERRSSGPGQSFSMGGAALVGRQAELAAMESSWQRLDEGRARAVLVSGESGLGKTALVRRFIHDAMRGDGVVLVGTCYERESVPYKAIDGAIDSLSQHLLSLTSAEVEAMLPSNAAVLSQAFPVLGRIESVIESSLGRSDVLDPLELRRQLFVGLRELLGRLCAKRRVALVIEDVQWADADSLGLLSELMRGPGEPRLLLVLSLRSSDVETRQGWQVRLAETFGDRVESVALERMNLEESKALAETLLQRAGVDDPALARTAVQEGGGHPLFISELIRLAELGSAPGQKLTLEEALWLRTSHLDESARSVLELVSLAAGKTLQQTIAQAAGLDRALFGRVIGKLRVEHLVRTNGMRATDLVEPFHDKVRVAVRAHLSAEELRKHHRRLALALERAEGTDPALLSLHWFESGELERAGTYAQSAAERAYRALAFDRAAELYARALELLKLEPPQQNALRASLGDALSKAGRGGEAAEVFLAAAGTSGPMEAMELNRLAADQLLRSGHVDRGLGAIREVLGVAGLELAGSPTRALLSLGLSRARLGIRRLGFVEQSARLISPSALFRIDATWSAAAGLSVVDPIRASDIQTRNLLFALDAGEPYRIARALAMEAAFVSTAGSKAQARATALVERADEISKRIGNAHALGLATLVNGFVGFQNGWWARARDALSKAEHIFRTQCSGASWEVETSYLFRFETHYYLGELARLAAGVREQLAEATARRDFYATTNLRLSHLNLVWLMSDQLDEAVHHAERARAEWSGSGYLAQHWYAAVALLNIDLYRRDAANGWVRFQENWKALQRSMLTRVQSVRIESWHVWSRAALAAGKLAEAKEGAKRLAAEKVPWATALSMLVRAGLHAAEGDTGHTVQALASAEQSLEAAGLGLYRTAAQWHRGRWQQGQQGESARRDAALALEREGVVRVEDFVQCVVPGFAVGGG